MNRPLITAALLAAICAPAWAINKCTGADGNVVFQDGPCSSRAKSQEIPSACCSPADTKKSWQFERSMDSMTGVLTCFATSPPVEIAAGPRAVASIYMQIAMRPDFASLTIRTNKQTDIFHHLLDGSGIKVGSFDFLPITQKVNANGVGFANPVDSAMVVLKMLPASKDVKVRLRFWPWEQLNDSFEPIPLQGFKQAYALAEDCSKKK